MAPGQPRILVSGGDGEYSSLLVGALRESDYEPTASAAVPTPEMVSAHRIDLIILSIEAENAPRVCELTRELRRRSDIPILLIDRHDSVPTRVAGLESGADNALPDPSVREVVRYTELLLRRTGRLSSPISEVADLVVDHAARTAVRAGHLLALTKTEFELLVLFVRNSGKTVSKRQLFQHVWGPEDFNRHLVEVHVSSLRRKLERHGSRMIHTVAGEGYVLAPD